MFLSRYVCLLMLCLWQCSSFDGSLLLIDDAGSCDGDSCDATVTDSDGDGFASSVDCDDNDESIGSDAQRACQGSCAPGLERCVSGTWQACDAPEDCSCTIGQSRNLDCAMCGTQAQICPEGSWQNNGTCLDQGSCSPGSLETSSACGNCGVLQRLCNEDCSWGQDSCVNEGVCTAGQVFAEEQACGTNGTRSRTCSCSNSCTVSNCSAWSSCTECTETCPAENDLPVTCNGLTATSQQGCAPMQSKTCTCIVRATGSLWLCAWCQ
ncbi:MAG: hypothetical protein IPJ88_00790 [Myxococcales bacterium]|nr:MAG: hypothetical protein IPJ88_00790 [Myxococcales bacterium]